MRTLAAIERRRKKNREWGYANDHLRVSFLGCRKRLRSEELVAEANSRIGPLVEEFKARQAANRAEWREQLNAMTDEERTADVAAHAGLLSQGAAHAAVQSLSEVPWR
jgi:hypothetical protein